MCSSRCTYKCPPSCILHNQVSLWQSELIGVIYSKIYFFSVESLGLLKVAGHEYDISISNQTSSKDDVKMMQEQQLRGEKSWFLSFIPGQYIKELYDSIRVA